jgi:LEA14-like dessication related protein
MTRATTVAVSEVAPTGRLPYSLPATHSSLLPLRLRRLFGANGPGSGPFSYASHFQIHVDRPGARFSFGRCASISRPPGLSTSVINFRPTNASLLETSAELTVRLLNDTPQAMTVVGSSHRLYLNKGYVGQGVSNDRITVPAFGSATQTVTIYLENLALLRKARELASTPTIAYRLESRLQSAPEQGGGSIDARADGELDVSNLGDLLRIGSS